MGSEQLGQVPLSRLRIALRPLFSHLQTNLDPGRWWPAESDFEVVVGAVLTQNTAWRNVEVAIANLRQANLLSPAALLAASEETIALAIRPSGFFRAKTSYLRSVAKWYLERGQVARQLPTETLREELLQLRGVGEETADDILVYVYQRPLFIYDAYARRLLEAAGWGKLDTYGQAKAKVDSWVHAANFNASELAQFHALIVEAGKRARQQGWPLPPASPPLSPSDGRTCGSAD